MKSFHIEKTEVVAAFQSVKENRGAAGVDRETILKFEEDLLRNLYVIWNRMSSGSYFPPPVRAVSIPKKDGSKRILGVPTVRDRIAQTVVKRALEPNLERVFHPNSFGYRPGRSAHQAISITRTRCWRYDWVLEFDVQKMFDCIDHALLMKALRFHTQEKWILLYVERWLKAPIQTEDGEIQQRRSGTPQGGVLSPLLANLFMHYAFDAWMEKTFPSLPFCRYADDGAPRRRERRTQVVNCSVLCCAGNEGGPLEAAVQAVASNNRERLRPKTAVVSVTEKAWLDHVMCAAGRRKTEPLMNSRKHIDDVKTGRASLARDKSGGYLFTDPVGVRLRGGVNLQQVLARNVGTLPAMLREHVKWRTHKALSTNVQVRGGLARSSEEGW